MNKLKVQLACISASSFLAFSVSAQTIYVDSSSTCTSNCGGIDAPYSAIQPAIDGSSNGDAIIVANGPYTENLNITKQVALQSPSGSSISPANTGIATITINTVSSLSGFDVTGGTTGITVKANNAIIDGNTVHGATNGIYLATYTNSVTISNNLIEHNQQGIMIERNSTNHSIHNNIIRASTRGLYFRQTSNYNSIENNYIRDNLFGIRIPEYTTGNAIFHNNFIGNTYNLSDPFPSAAAWDNGYESGGNYWSDYNAVDTNGDHVADSPYGRDFFPVMSENGWDYITPEMSIHNLNKGLNYASIQEAINDATPGDILDVDGGNITGIGRYYDNIDLNKAITLQALDGASIYARLAGRSPVTLSSDNATIDGFRISGAGKYGETGLIVTADHGTIRNNQVEGNYYGIFLNSGVSNTSITGNIVRHSSRGITLYMGAKNNLVSGNEISNNMIAMSYHHATDNTLQDNTLSHNSYTIWGSNYAKNNLLYHNNFIDNTYNIHPSSNNNAFIWDKGYPDGGNHWSNWTAPDVMSGPNQDIAGADGFVDITYIKDRYPYVNPNGWLPTNTAPIANAGSDQTVYPLEAFTLDATASSDAEGEIAQYCWDFGDGYVYCETSLDFSDGAFDGQTSYLFDTSGDHSITLTVTDADGASASDEAIVTVLTLSEGTVLIKNEIIDYNLPQGAETSLTSKLDAAQAAISGGDTQSAIDSIQALLNQLSANGFCKNKATPEICSDLSADAQRLLDSLNAL